MKYSDILIKTKQLLYDESSWFKGYYACSKDKPDYLIEYDDPNANCFCIRGAMCKVGNFTPFANYDKSLSTILSQFIPVKIDCIYKTGILSQYNDLEDTKHSDILKLLDQGIAYTLDEGI